MMKTIQKACILFFTVFLCIGVAGCKKDKLAKQQQVNEVIQRIDALPSSDLITIDDEVEIVKARVLYNNLDQKSRLKVTNLEKLENLEKKLVILIRDAAYQFHALEVVHQIEELPMVDLVTIEDDEKIAQVRIMYNQLSPEAKINVNNYDKLEELEIIIARLKKEAAYYAKAQAIIDRIDALPNRDEITLEYKEELASIREAYNILNSDLQILVTNLDRLSSLERRIEELELELYYKKEVDKVIQMIEELPQLEEATLEDEEKIMATRRAYSQLDFSVQYLVSNYEKLSSLENKLIELKEEMQNQQIINAIIEQINELPNIEEITLDDQKNIEKVRMAYNALDDRLKNQVTNYQKLLDVEEKIQALIPYEIHYYYIQDQELENVTREEISPVIATAKINYVSDGFWYNYSSEVFIYKTALLSASDRYQYALKIGCSYDQEQNSYVITQIIESSEILTVDHHNCEFFIFVHPSNMKYYEKLVNAKVGDLVYLDKPMASGITTNYGANLTITQAGEVMYTDYFVGRYQGTTVLPIPKRMGYVFMGWYNNAVCTGEKIEVVNSEQTLYASWEIDIHLIEPENMMTCVSDIATSYTKDKLISKDERASYEWSSSNPNLYVIKDGYGTVSKRYQTRKSQKVEISLKITYHDGTESIKKKEITIAPVEYTPLPDTPIATYFYSTGTNYYQMYNERYKNGGPIFSKEAIAVLDVVYYAFAPIAEDGTIELETPDYIEDVLALKENNTRVVLCVDGVTKNTSRYFDEITADPIRRQNFVKHLVDLIEKYNFDGVDIDWESAGGSTTVKATGLNPLMKEIREELTSRTEEDATPYFVSIAVPAGTWGNSVDHFDYGFLNQYVDYINLMSYNMNNTSITSHGSPMYISSNDNGYGFGSYHGALRLASLSWPKNKLMIGGSGYGKGYKVTGESTNSMYPGLGVAGKIGKIPDHEGSLASGTVMGKATVDLLNSGKYQKYIEYNNNGQLVGSYIYSATDQYFVTYDSMEVVKAKYEYANSNEGMGLMWWCYQFDTEDFFPRALYEEIYG